MNKKKGLLMLFVLFAIIWQVSIISAVNLGVSPASIQFKKVLRGGYAERNIVVSVDSPRDVIAKILLMGEIASWLNLSETNFTLSKDKPHIIKISVTPPIDMPNGDYSGFVEIKLENLGEGVEERLTGVIVGSLDLAVGVEVTDIEAKECRASNFEVFSAEKGDDIIFNLEISNDGNVRFKPKIKIDIWDEEQLRIVKTIEFTENEIKPTIQDKFSMRVKSDSFEIGQYWADVSALDCLSSQTLTFDVLEPGALKANGILTGIITKKEGDVDETIPIFVGFKNTGEKEVTAQFKGKISIADKIVQILESESNLVPVKESSNFSFYFTPKQAGKYVISGRVFYSGKRTFESSATVNIKEKAFNWWRVVVYGMQAVLILVVILMVYKIRKERKVYMGKIKSIRRLR